MLRKNLKVSLEKDHHAKQFHLKIKKSQLHTMCHYYQKLANLLELYNVRISHLEFLAVLSKLVKLSLSAIQNGRMNKGL